MDQNATKGSKVCKRVSMPLWPHARAHTSAATRASLQAESAGILAPSLRRSPPAGATTTTTSADCLRPLHSSLEHVSAHVCPISCLLLVCNHVRSDDKCVLLHDFASSSPALLAPCVLCMRVCYQCVLSCVCVCVCVCFASV